MTNARVLDQEISWTKIPKADRHKKDGLTPTRVACEALMDSIIRMDTAITNTNRIINDTSSSNTSGNHNMKKKGVSKDSRYKPYYRR